MLSRHAGRAAGLWVVALLAVNPTFIRYGYSAATDMPALALESLALLLLVGACAGADARAGEEDARPPRDAARAVLLAGLVAGFAVLTRYSAALLLPAGLIALALRPPPAMPRARAALTFVIGFLIPVLPWALYSVAHGFFPGEYLFRYFSFYSGRQDTGRSIQDLNPHLPESMRSYHSLGHMMREDSRALILGSLRNIPKHLVQDARELLGWPAALLALAGLAILPLTRAARRLAPMWIFGALLVLLFAPVFYSHRYVMPVIPVELSLAAIALALPELRLPTAARAGASPGRARRVPRAGLVSALAGGLVLLLGLRASFFEHREVRRLLPTEVLEAGRALRATASPGERIMSRKGHIGYYSGLDVVPFPRFSSLAELADEARASHADYLYFSWYEAQLRPEFSWLLDTTATAPGLERVCLTARKPSVVYRLGPGFGRDPEWLSDPWLTRLHEARAMVDVLPESLTAQYRIALAIDALDRGAPAVALELADQAGRRLPNEPLVWQTRGRALLELSRPADAAAAFSRAVQLDPNDPETRRALGIAFVRAGNLPEAGRAWRGLVADTDDAELLAVMQRAFEQAGDRASADSARVKQGRLRG